jgi:hypothetical protein
MRVAKILGLAAGALLAAGAALAAALFVWFYIVVPKRVGRQYENFSAAHKVGQTAAALADDDFFWETTTFDLYDLDKPALKDGPPPPAPLGPQTKPIEPIEIRLPVFSAAFGKVMNDGAQEELGPAQRKKVRDLLAGGIRNGTIDLMWTQVPPFGRVILDIGFKNGVITDIRRGSLD